MINASSFDSHLIPADWTCVFPLKPLVDALSVKDMVAEEFLERLVFI